jgi:regulator of protease activity HflC (stomatin/prohibitin superfamily)
LVLEREYSRITADEWLPAPGLARMLKAALGATAGIIVALLALRSGFVWAPILLQVVACLTAAVAVELVGRAFIRTVLPGASGRRERQVRSSVVDLLVPGVPKYHRLENSPAARFGTDLERAWALGLIRSAALPTVAGLALAAWLLTGVREIGLDGRGVYERLGIPSSVLAPGLHVTLPWPFGRVRMVENGAIHEVDLASDDAPTQRPLAPATVGAEDPAPGSADRLWDTDHRGEVSYLIAGLSDQRQSFEAVDVDVRFVYRIGLSDAAALATAYKASDPAELVRAWGGRLLMRYFSARTLDAVLGDAREQLSADLSAALQSDLDKLGSGIEVLDTVVEAIHPPSGAANAYHQVQAAEIRAEAQIQAESGAASKTLNAAETQAAADIDRSTAAAAETRSEAAADEIRFTADRGAAESGGPSFLLERYFSGLSRGLASKRLIIVDHRISSGTQPTFDLRPAAASGDPAGLPGLLGPAAKPD